MATGAWLIDGSSISCRRRQEERAPSGRGEVLAALIIDDTCAAMPSPLVSTLVLIRQAVPEAHDIFVAVLGVRVSPLLSVCAQS